MRTSDCKINFAVPSDRILSKNAEQYRIDVSKPGVLDGGLNAFSTAYPGAECKISLDRKKIAYGYGKHHGEENLDGNEASPSLQERQRRATEGEGYYFWFRK